MKANKKRSQTIRGRIFHRFMREDKGATALEFAFVALPFLVILFGIIELAIVFFVNSALNHATAETGRLVRVGRFQGCGTADEFKAVICAKMANVSSCNRNLRIDVITDAKFSTLTIEDAPEPEDQEAGEEPPAVGNGVYQDTNGGENVVVRAVFDYRLVLPEKMTRLGNPKNSGVRQLYAMTAFRNEPFNPSAGCDSEVQSLIDAATGNEGEDSTAPLEEG